ncbi:MAG: tRNA (guanosine(37)-N1)-methyltransferase TrmD [Myxococcales bacterium]|nr:tRNA (guanosine(37)-N1)-methyltransferase TrmD [Myxococcales bacterium]
MQAPAAAAVPPCYRFDVLTLFPGLFESLRRESLIGKAIAAGRIDLAVHDWRAFAMDRHHTVDDAPFGGGAGMVLKPEPIAACLAAVCVGRPAGIRTVLLSPAGARFDQRRAEQYAEAGGLVLLCGRYEGFDARIEDLCDEVLSLGDFVLQGGEVAAMAVVEAVARLLPGVVGNAASLSAESHADGLVEHPHYTRPRQWQGRDVPAVLLSGDHAAIVRWRRAQSLARTARWRPDLLASAPLSPDDRAQLAGLSAAPVVDEMTTGLAKPTESG